MSRTRYAENVCPDRIFDDFGGGFGMGCVGGCVFYFVRGFLNAPKKERFFGGIKHLKRRAPVLGGNFALWAGIFSSTECLLTHFRNKEDFINPIVAGFITGGILAFRSGPRVAFRNALFGGIILAMIGLTEQVFIRYQMKKEHEMAQIMHEQEMKRQIDQLREMRPDLFAAMESKKKREKSEPYGKVVNY